MSNGIAGKKLECCPYLRLNGDMNTRNPALPDDFDGAPGPYDAGPEVKDLWVLPDDAAERDSLAPLPRADRPLFSMETWRKAEARNAAPLADVAFRLGVLDERLRGFGAGGLERLAITAAQDWSWGQGDRIGADRLVLWMEMSLAGAQDDPGALARASWVARRLAAPRSVADSGLGTGLCDLLGRDSGQSGVADLAEVMAGSEVLHPLTRGALAFHAWRMLGPEGAVTGAEALVLGARVAASFAKGGAHFLPVGLAGLDGTRGKDPAEKLGNWLRSAERGTFAALMMLGQLTDWQGRARADLSDLQGRTPAELIALFLKLPVVTAALAEARLGVGRSTVQRNLDLMQARGLIREITGQGRFRVWVVQV